MILPNKSLLIFEIEKENFEDMHSVHPPPPPPPPRSLSARKGGGEFEPPTKFSKRGDLTGPQL